MSANGLKRRAWKIEPFKHKVDIDPNFGDNAWKLLQKAILEIFNQNASGLSFEELYRTAYNMVLHKFGDLLYNGLRETIQGHLHGRVRALQGANGEALLALLFKEWSEYNKSMQMVRDILMYLNRTYVPQQGKVAVEALGLQLWLEEVVQSEALRPRVVPQVLDMVAADRAGTVVSEQLIRQVIQMLTDLGPGAYEKVFEAPFLEMSGAHFAALAAKLYEEHEVPAYLQRVEAARAEEGGRVTRYLNEATRAKILLVVESELLAKKLPYVLGVERRGFEHLVDQGAAGYGDLRRLHTLLQRVPGAVDELKRIFYAKVHGQGCDLVRDAETVQTNVSYVEGLLRLKAKFHSIIEQSFDGDKGFATTTQKAFEAFVNLNPASAEHISLFLDEHLRTGFKGMADADVEALTDQVMLLFRYLQDKDVFEKYFKTHLAKRLLSPKAAAEDQERAIILKLKTECGYQFTSKVESMFTDMATSRDLLAGFKESRNQAAEASAALPDPPPVDLAVQVLTSGAWPLPPPGPCEIPAPLREAAKTFEEYYLGVYSGRKLTWQTGLGTVELKAQFQGKGGGSGKKHELSVSIPQACVLMLFADRGEDWLPFAEIAKATQLEAPELKRALRALACVKGKNVLVKAPPGKAVEEGDRFQFNESFQSKMYRVKLGASLAVKDREPAPGGDRGELRKRVEEDRKPQVEAAIVRLMKARRTLHHNGIVAEVTQQLQPRFLPAPQLIKARLETLCERGYVERDAEDSKLWHYVA